jgi:hypothetical protein
MKVIIAGSRSFSDVDAVRLVDVATVASGFEITEVVSGGARPIDQTGECWANERGVPIRRFLPQYHRYPRHVAPVMRNQEMAEYADALIAIWDGVSRGTADMVRRANQRGMPVYVTIPEALR